MSKSYLRYPLLWMIEYDRRELKGIDKEKNPVLWKMRATQLGDEELIYAINRGEFLIEHNLVEDWKKGQYYF